METLGPLKGYKDITPVVENQLESQMQNTVQGSGLGDSTQ